VITAPTNLYSQKLMPSLDYTLSLHIGVTARMASAQPVDVNALEQIVMADAWRRREQAAELLNKADEAEDFQAVGMRRFHRKEDGRTAANDCRLMPPNYAISH
jgi:hypothetical protein